MHSLEDYVSALPGRLLARIIQLFLVAMLSVSVVACGGDDDNDRSPPTDDGGGSGNGNDDDDDNDDDNDDGAEIGWNASAEGAISAKDQIVVTFDEPVDPETLQADGVFADAAEMEWSEDNTQLTLTPRNYWPFGPRSLDLEVTGDGGSADVEVSFDVDPAFDNAQDASVVIGQADFTTGESRQGGTAPGANTLDEPLGAPAYAPEQDILFITDTWDSRVLGFRGIPEMNNQTAEFVLGQPNFTNSAGQSTQAGMVSPQYVTTDHGRLIVTDTEAYRVSIYDGIPEDGSALPSVVVGQPSFEGRIDNPPCDARTMNHSHGHFLTESGMFLVASSWQNRVLIWDQLPTEDYQPADMVLGQPNLETCLDVPNGPAFRHPTDIWTDEEKLVIVDSEKNRVLIWNEFPDENFEAPDVILGQSDIRNEAPNDDNQDGVPDEQASPRVLDYPRSLHVDEHGQMFVEDMNNHRILIWYEIPTESFAPADVVIGQADFADTGGVGEISEDPPSARTFNSPTGVRVINDKLFVTERFNHRVLMFEAQ